MKNFYITLPIYYANWIPHIWHAYSSLVWDVFARSKRLLWYDVKFSVGTDENGQKMIQKAEELWMEVMDYLDNIAFHHKTTREKLEISVTDFIRTTEDRHKVYVQKILEQTHINWDLYQDKYEGLYCVGCEAFKKESDLIKSDGNHWIDEHELVCPDHFNKHLSSIEENNWFFKLSKYENYLKEFYRENPRFQQPDHRFNEVKAFVEQGLHDFSISREGSTFGIPLPFDDDQVAYIRYDALLNYNTLCENDQEHFRPVNLQVMWKEITRFHGIFYPAMLKSVGIEPPKQQLVTWFLTVDGKKMWKSLGNSIEPAKLAEDYDRDAVVMYLLYDLKIGSDWDFSRRRFEEMYNAMLIWGWGNLISRVTKLAAKNDITKIEKEAIESRLQAYVSDVKENNDHFNELVHVFIDKSVDEALEYYLKKLDLQHLIRDWYNLVQAANKFLNDAEPWKKLKNEETKKDGLHDLQFMLYIIKNLTILASPFLINGTKKSKKILGIKALDALTTTETMPENKLQELFDITETDLTLQPDIVYKKKEE